MNITAKDLESFTGTEGYYFLPGFPNYNYTDGIRYLAIEAQAYWLITDIFRWQQSLSIKNDTELQYFQMWILKVDRDSSAILTCYRDTDQPVITQKIPFTDFPLAQVKLYLKQNVLLLPSEN